MRRLLSIAVVVLAAAVVAARSGMQAPEPEGEKKLIDLKSDLMGPIAPGDSVVFLVGNFAAQHNGAVITCDSAVRYSDMRIEFFGNVLINKNTTYIYGDRAEYDGELNEARVYSDIVKVVDGDATLYTYKFLFNTKKNIGEFADGGVMLNRENLLESVRGYYYADTKELIDPAMKLTRELFIFSCETGLRFSDVLDLKWTHLKNIKGVTYISKIQCKTKELVEIPVTLKWPKVLLAKYRNVSTGEHVFPSLSNNCVNRKLKMLAEKAGIGKRLSFHVARHTFASHLANAGVPLYIVAKLLGDKSLDMVHRVYTNTERTELTEAMKKLSA